MAKQIQYIGARYVVKIYENKTDPSSAEWDENVNYEPLVMVTFNNGSYLSKKDVPASVGNPAENPTYWVQTGFYNGQIVELQNLVNNLNTRLSAEVIERTNADSQLQGFINTLSISTSNTFTELRNADSSIMNDVTNEVNARQSADSSIINDYNTKINNEANARTIADATLQTQIDELVAPSGEAPNPAEIVNARVGYNGETYDSLGNAIRGQVDEIHRVIDIDSFIEEEIDYEVVTGKYYYKGSGALVTNAGAKYIAPMSVEEGEIYTITGEFGGDVALVAAFASDSSYVRASSVEKGSGTTFVDKYIYTVPSGVASIGLSATGSRAFTIAKLIKTNIAPTVESGTAPKNINPAIQNGAYFNRSGGTSALAGASRTGLIKVSEGEKYYVSCKYGVDIAGIAAFDSSYAYVSASSLIDADGTHIVTDYEYTVPSGVGFLGFSSNETTLVVKKLVTQFAGDRSLKNSEDIGDVNELDTSDKSSLVNAINEVVSYAGSAGDLFTTLVSEKRFKDKKIVWFGTSIPEGGGAGGSYPNIIGQLLGATVYNEAVGSSRVHCKYPITPTADNPYQMGNGFDQCSRCLTNSLTEMQWIIDNYDSSHWTAGTGAPVTMTPEIAEFIRSCSYERKIDKYLTEETFPDLFVFDHGHNDAPHSLEEHDEYYAEYGTYNLYEFRGAMNFLINRILSYNPRARIVMIGEYAGTDESIIPAIQLEVARDWDIPICKNWEKLGWTKSQNVTLNGHWEQSGANWNWVSGEATEMTVFNAWIPDNVHPNKDRSGRAINHMAYNIARWLIDDVVLSN